MRKNLKVPRRLLQWELVLLSAVKKTDFGLKLQQDRLSIDDVVLIIGGQ